MKFPPSNPSRNRSRWTIPVLFLAGPVIWYAHFWGVYLLAEAVCDGGGSDVRWLGLRPLSFITVATTAVAAGMALWFAAWSWRHYRHGGGHSDPDLAENEGALAFTGALLGVVFFVSVLFVGVPALFLRPC